MFLQNLVRELLDTPEFGHWELTLAMPEKDYHSQQVNWHRDINDARLETQLAGDASRANSPEELGAWIETMARNNPSDVVYFPYPYHARCPDLPLPMVGTFHDFNHKRFDTWSDGMRANIERDLPRWIERCVPIVSSRFIAAELISYYPQAWDRVRVIPLGIPKSAGSWDEKAWSKFRVEREIPLPYTLSVGWLAPHKNQAILLEAIAALRDSGETLAGVFVGPNSSIPASMQDSYVRHMVHVADNWQLVYGKDYIGLGYVSAGELDMLYGHAAALVMPTLYEAGSFPVREAMRLGCPVICSDIPPLLEDIGRVGENTAITFDPFDVDDLVSALRNVVQDPLAAQGRARRASDRIGEAFDWRATARGYAAVFEAALISPPAPVAA